MEARLNPRNQFSGCHSNPGRIIMVTQNVAVLGEVE